MEPTGPPSPRSRGLPPAVIALTRGFPPYARPFSPAVLMGRDSLLGERLSPSLQAYLSNVRPPDKNSPAGRSGAGIPLTPPKEETAGEDPFAVPAVVYLAEEVTSTFDLAWKLLETDALPPWGAVLAARQTEGRGQYRRSWQSLAGNLHLTFRLPEGANPGGGAASVLTGYLLASAFRRLGFPLSLKWPNDLLLGDRDKVGGILLEERGGILLAGVGINLAHAPRPEDLRRKAATPAGTLFGDRGEERFPSPFALWRSLVGAAIVEYTRNVAHRGLSEILADLVPLLAWRNSPVIVTDGGDTRISGLYVGIGPEGDLLLRLDTGEIRSLHGGSLSRP